MKNKLQKLLETHQIICTDKQLQQFELFFDLLIEWNQKMNLTAIVEPEEVLIKHYFDSITPAFHISFTNQRIVDIGSGAGFPSIPLKICFPELKVTLLDSLKKRLTFLDVVIKDLHLDNIFSIHSRAEELAHNNKYRQTYDIAISRAVARLNILAELALPYVKVGGLMVALKGANAYEEEAEARRAIHLLGANLVDRVQLELPNHHGNRTIFFIEKVNNTPNKYPRKPGIPNRSPII